MRAAVEYSVGFVLIFAHLIGAAWHGDEDWTLHD
jgi:hypothetical protein